ncbi:MAG: TetR/AcrR family transcriptional regulator [Lysobacterales bacterium]
MTKFDPSEDVRIQRTRTALTDAFFKLVLSKPYGEISVNGIVSTAGVGRSTFYQHFSSKDDILLYSLAWPMSVLAYAAKKNTNKKEIEAILEHFWKNRSLARHVFTGTTRKVAVKTLAKELEKNAENYPFHISKEFYFEGMAEMLISLITAWLTGRVQCSAEELVVDIVKLLNSILYQL